MFNKWQRGFYYFINQIVTTTKHRWGVNNTLKQIDGKQCLLYLTHCILKSCNLFLIRSFDFSSVKKKKWMSNTTNLTVMPQIHIMAVVECITIVCYLIIPPLQWNQIEIFYNCFGLDILFLIFCIIRCVVRITNINEKHIKESDRKRFTINALCLSTTICTTSI